MFFVHVVFTCSSAWIVLFQRHRPCWGSPPPWHSVPRNVSFPCLGPRGKNWRRENHGKTWRINQKIWNLWTSMNEPNKFMVNGWYFFGDSNSWYMNYHPSITIHSEWPWKKRILPCGWMEMEIVIFPTYIHMEMVIFPVSTCYITMKCYIHSLWKFQKHSHVGLLSHFLWSCSCVIYGWIVGMNSILHG